MKPFWNLSWSKGTPPQKMQETYEYQASIRFYTNK